MSDPMSGNPLDELAQAHAAGLSRRQVLARMATGAVAASPLGVAMHGAAPAWAAATRARRGAACKACKLGVGGVSCTACAAGERGPMADQLLRLTRSNKEFRRLRAYAVAHHYRVGPPRVFYMRELGVQSFSGLEYKLTGLAKAHGSLLLIARGTNGIRDPLALIVETTGNAQAPTIAVTARERGGVVVTNPWDAAGARRSAIRLDGASPQVSGTARAAATAESGYTCDELCALACKAIRKACDAGTLAAMASCFKTKNPFAIAACAAAALAACELGADQQTCQDYTCGIACGCKLGEELCPGGTLGLVKCTPISTNTNCGYCGHACVSPMTCMGTVLDGYLCRCDPSKCPADAPPDPNNNCACTQCIGDVGCPPGAGKMCCSGNCVDVQTDNSNCGTCGIKCAVPATCVNGKCCGEVCAPNVCCPPGTHCCIDVPSQNLYNCCPDAYGCCGAYFTCNSTC